MAPARHAARDAAAILAEGFALISLEQMDAVALLDRIDTKFVLTAGQLLDALAALQASYCALDIAGQRLIHYRTLYFDTPDFDLYRAHATGRAERYKVRSREYVESQTSFLEVKHRTRKGRTIKQRILTPQPATQLTVPLQDWLAAVSPLAGGALEPKLWNTFRRLTLVARDGCERVTLDLDVAFCGEDRRAVLDGIAVAEVKVDVHNRVSPFIAQMRNRRIHAHGFSKYAVGTAMLYERVKKNALKPGLLWIEKTRRGTANDG
jgi:hypothetical protein